MLDILVGSEGHLIRVGNPADKLVSKGGARNGVEPENSRSKDAASRDYQGDPQVGSSQVVILNLREAYVQLIALVPLYESPLRLSWHIRIPK